MRLRNNVLCPALQRQLQNQLINSTKNAVLGIALKDIRHGVLSTNQAIYLKFPLKALIGVYLLSTLYYLPKHCNTATHVAKGAFMSLLSLAYIREESPCRRSPGKPSRLMILSRLGGTMDMQRWKRPYPKLTAPFSLFRDSSDTPSATMWLSFAVSEVKGSSVSFFWHSSWRALMSR